MKRILQLAAAAMILGLLAGPRALADDAAKQKACELHLTGDVTMKYLLYLPKDYAAKPAWPLMLFLHGAGERGDDLNDVKKHGPPKLIEAGKQFPFVVVSPQCPKSHWWKTSELSALLDEIEAKYKIDKDRIYLTGLSMGGFGTWALAIHQPDRFAAIVPICGGGDPAKAEKIKHIPTWVFHGGKDPTVPLASSQKMVDALKQAGGNPKFTIYPDAKHDSWTQAYSSPELYEWLLKQKRVAKKGS